MIKLIWKLLEIIDDNWGYNTPLQKRYKVGDKCMISPYKITENTMPVHEEVIIIQNGRYDYLIQDSKGKMQIVYQFELMDMN